MTESAESLEHEQEMPYFLRVQELNEDYFKHPGAWIWNVHVSDPSGMGNSSITNATTPETAFGVGKRNGELMMVGEKILNLFTYEHSLHVIAQVKAVVDAELANRPKWYTALKSEHDALKEEYNEHKKEETKEEMEKKDKEIKQLESQIKNKDRSIQHLQKRLKNKDRAYKDLQDQLKKKDRSIQDLHNHIQRLDCRHIHGLSYIPSLQECEQRSRH
tara:strand:- start:1282 stop:1932 length:651 start_codon:yes stop_codon:yes gene_type:complete